MRALLIAYYQEKTAQFHLLSREATINDNEVKPGVSDGNERR
jgi:hypothetical protein